MIKIANITVLTNIEEFTLNCESNKQEKHYITYTGTDKRTSVDGRWLCLYQYDLHKYIEIPIERIVSVFVEEDS